jgi:hypothetical protein
MTSTILHRLLSSGLISAGDHIAFNFKKDTFSAKVVAGGLIAQCTMNGDSVALPPFRTLTDWCDTCIQELVHEYVTRFSSWKRVKHGPTGRTFTQLRELLGQQEVAAVACRCAEALAQRRRVVELEQEIQLLRQQYKTSAAQEVVADDNPFTLKF